MLVEVKNEGNLKTTFAGDILLYGAKRRFPYRAMIPADADGKPSVIYPGCIRRVRCPVMEALPPGNYRAEARLKMARRWRTRSSFDIVVPPRGSAVTQDAVLVSKSEFDIDFSVEPSYVEVMLPTGATRAISIRVQNRDSVAVNTKASIVSVIQEPNGFLTYADLADTIEQWVQISPNEWTMAPRSAETVLLNITAPEYRDNASAMCAVRILGTAGLDEANWLSEADIGVPIIAVPPGASSPQLEISNLEVIRPAPDLNPTAAVLVVQNIGGRTGELKGEVVLERARTREVVQTMIFSEFDGLLLAPGVVREFRMALPYLDIDEFRLRTEVSIVGQPKSATSSEITFICSYGPD
jgi:hypothetical protein